MTKQIDVRDIPVVILCGGQGTRLREKTEELPKPMVCVGSRPILWHIMSIYAHYGFRNFVLALGYKGDKIKEYFLNYRAFSSDFTLTIGEDHSVQYHMNEKPSDWKITCVDTGQDAMTGSRIARLAKYINSDVFMMTYGDGLADINLSKLLNFHLSHGRVGTVTGVHSPSRFGKLSISDKEVTRFTEKPIEDGSSDYINGGYFVFQKKFLGYLTLDDACVLEQGPLESLAQDKELMIYQHSRFWRCMDTYRDWLVLEELFKKGHAPWMELEAP